MFLQLRASRICADSSVECYSFVEMNINELDKTNSNTILHKNLRFLVCKMSSLLSDEISKIWKKLHHFFNRRAVADIRTPLVFQIHFRIFHFLGFVITQWWEFFKNCKYYCKWIFNDFLVTATFNKESRTFIKTKKQSPTAKIIFLQRKKWILYCSW